MVNSTVDLDGVKLLRYWLVSGVSELLKKRDVVAMGAVLHMRDTWGTDGGDMGDTVLRYCDLPFVALTPLCQRGCLFFAGPSAVGPQPLP